jgi:hypothetical protein
MPDDFDLDAYFNRIADELGEVLDKVFDLEPAGPGRRGVRQDRRA